LWSSKSKYLKQKWWWKSTWKKGSQTRLIKGYWENGFGSWELREKSCNTRRNIRAKCRDLRRITGGKRCNLRRKNRDKSVNQRSIKRGWSWKQRR